MATDYLTGSAAISDHDLTIAIPGDVETVRRRIVNAVQHLGYKILSEQPINAKRSGEGSARWDCSLNVLDYPTTLLLSLKQMNDVAVIATFNYEVKSYMCMTKGDRQTLAREAEAIVALATERMAISACPACGVQITDDSHFCRKCGAPLVLEVAELEVLRLTKGARSSYHNIFVGMLALLCALLPLLPVFLVDSPKLYKAMLFISLSFAGLAFLALLQGVWQLHFTLNPKSTKKVVSKPRPTFAAPHTAALPPRSAQQSVTEGTTELLFDGSDRRVPEPIPRKTADTSDIDEERLM
ncbi:MAG TPA: zinc ribbon domain-containing protein [Pyrinomonadaceae bacterium]|nr:zinc ribbon domain-containing protein [Pyrinomonadaceae bacterium]